MSVIKLGSVTASEGASAPNRMAILLWGPATCGKTTLCATAPGKKLWLSFGDNEHVPVMHRKDVMIADLSDLSIDELFQQAQNDNPFGLDQMLSAHDEITTIVCDSATALAYRALQKAVLARVGAGRDFAPTMMAPGISAYGGRNAVVLECITGLLRVTAKHGVHLIVTAHEDDPHLAKDQRGNDIIEYITVMLGGKLVNNMSWRWSEIWYMSQKGTGEHERRIAIRPTRVRRPMKTRMFSDKGPAEFNLLYDADKPDKGQMTIAGWYEQWIKNDFVKIPVPINKGEKKWAS